MDHLVAAAERRLDIQLTGERLGRARHAAHFGQGLRRTQQRLRRHAGVIRALAAHKTGLDDRHLEPAVGEASRTHLPGGPGPHHYRVEFASFHGLAATLLLVT